MNEQIFIVLNTKKVGTPRHCVIYSTTINDEDDILPTIEDFFESKGREIDPEEEEEIASNLATQGYADWKNFRFELCDDMMAY